MSRFSEGQEKRPHGAPDKRGMGRYSRGVDHQEEAAPEEERRAGSSRPGAAAAAGERCHREDSEPTVRHTLTNEQLGGHVAFLRGASRDDLDDLLTMLLSTAWPSWEGQMS